tara:strand:+ start:274 stop:549 length:276 start_codon:yes stop_codon:yes gene_type:complete
VEDGGLLLAASFTYRFFRACRMAQGACVKVGDMVNFIPPHNKPIPVIQGIILNIVEKPHSKGAKPTTHYEVHWLTGQEGGLFLPCQLEVAQ